MTALRDLRARVAALTGPDREVDYLLYRALFDWTAWLKAGNEISEHEAPSYTASIDAVEALRQRLLPGTVLTVIHDPGRLAPSGWRANWGSKERTRGGKGWPKHVGEAHAPTEPLARLLALLDALIAKEDICPTPNT